ncbi:hypothetical protein MUN89_18960 [Halobacillus salinarum]|uniref:Histidine kinase domain-containing protein n=1 Tax=Halobacillus salinarum TaxID=2932257 RepID=A0ABY4EJ95_9BACI|nr:ATP-binding protein [Halobacillus salinarum]UOQ43923.1 hypothetical protein MUN89_18960 [Halobacillus salinarum]
MKKVDNKKPIFFFAGICLIALYLIYVTLSVTYAGIDVKKTEDDQWKITAVDQIGWAEKRKVEPDDIVLEVNHQPPEFYSSIKKYGVIGKLDQLKVLRDGEVLEYKVQEPLNYNTLLYHTVIPFLVFTVLFVLSVYIYYKKNNEKLSLYLIALLLAVGLGYLSAGASARTDYIGRFMNGFSLLCVPVLFLHFYYQYFARYNIKLIQGRLLLFLYIINLTTVLLDTISMFVFIGGVYSIIRNLQLMLFSLEMLLGLFLLLYYYFRFRKTIHKPIFQNTIFSIIISFFPFIFLTVLPSTIFGVELLPPSVTAAFLIFLPIFFFYLVMTNRIFDIDFINSRLRYYSLVSLLLTTIIVGLFVFFVNLTWIQWARLMIIIYVSMVVFFYLEEKLNLRPLLFRDKFNFQMSIDRFAKDLSKIVKREELDLRLVEEIRDVLPVNSVSLLTYRKKDGFVKLENGDYEFPIQLIKSFLHYKQAELKTSDSFFVDQGICYVISERQESIRLLWIDQKINYTPFNQDEQRWLKTLSHYTSMVYENFLLIEGVTEELKQSMHQQQDTPAWMLRLLFNLSEKERSRLASDLHDSALQEQLVWYRKIDEFIEDKSFPVHYTPHLEQIREGLLGVVQQIRETCTLLRPPFLKETGVVEALTYLIHRHQGREQFEITFTSSHFTANLGDDQSLTIYRIVQELINNASKHSKASKVTLDLKSEGELVILNYEDDGVGFQNDPANQSSKSMGLAGIKQRVNSMQGSMEMFSSGDGVEIAILLRADLRMKNFFEVM